MVIYAIPKSISYHIIKQKALFHKHLCKRFFRRTTLNYCEKFQQIKEYPSATNPHVKALCSYEIFIFGPLYMYDYVSHADRMVLVKWIVKIQNFLHLLLFGYSFFGRCPLFLFLWFFFLSHSSIYLFLLIILWFNDIIFGLPSGEIGFKPPLSPLVRKENLYFLFSILHCFNLIS